MSVIEELKEWLEHERSVLRTQANYIKPNVELGQLAFVHIILNKIEELEARCRPGLKHHFVLHCVNKNCFNLACSHRKFEKCNYCKMKRLIEVREDNKKLVANTFTGLLDVLEKEARATGE